MFEIDKYKIEEIIEQEGQLIEMTVGSSMRPMLRSRRDVVVIAKAANSLKPNDVVLYNVNGKYVLHRIIKVKGDSLVIRGDNCIHNEYNVKCDNIIGILKGFYRGEKYIDCNSSKGYKAYIFICRATLYPRIAIKKLIGLFK